MNYSEVLHNATKEVAGNDRLRWGLGVILALLVTYLVLFLSDVNDELYIQSLRLATEVEDSRTMGTAALWQERLELERSIATQLKARLWTGSSEGIILAAIRSEIQAMAAGSAMQNARIEMGTVQPVAGLPGIFSVRTRVRGVIERPMLAPFVHGLEAHQPTLVIEQAEIRTTTTQNPAYVDVTILGYIERQQE